MLPLPGGGTQVDVLQAAWLVEPGTLRMAPMLYVPALTGNHAAHIIPQNFHGAIPRAIRLRGRPKSARLPERLPRLVYSESKS